MQSRSTTQGENQDQHQKTLTSLFPGNRSTATISLLPIAPSASQYLLGSGEAAGTVHHPSLHHFKFPNAPPAVLHQRQVIQEFSSCALEDRQTIMATVPTLITPLAMTLTGQWPGLAMSSPRGCICSSGIEDNSPLSPVQFSGQMGLVAGMCL